MKSRNRILFSLLLLIIVIIANNVMNSSVTIGGTCDFQGGWNRGKQQVCTCYGFKLTLDNTIDVDGDYHTACIGVGLKK